jgi:hypothetical protein
MSATRLRGLALAGALRMAANTSKTGEKLTFAMAWISRAPAYGISSRPSNEMVR